VYQMDVKCAFLNGELEETVYVEQPPGFIDSKFPNHCYYLEKVVYGLKQAPRAWYETLTRFLKSSGFKQGCVDPTLFRRRRRDHLMLLQIYLDDIIFVEGIFINQEKYTRNILSKFGTEACLNEKVPMDFGARLTPSLDKPAFDQTKYRSMIGSLLYLTSSRPDIMLAVCKREPHFKLLRIFSGIRKELLL